MRKITIRLTRDARFRAIKPELVEQAALAASETAGRGEIHFAPQQAEISTRFRHG